MEENGGAEHYEFIEHVVAVDTDKNLRAYLLDVKGFMNSKRSHSVYYTGAPTIIMSFDSSPVYVAEGHEALSFEGFVRWILNTCDCDRVLPPPDGFPMDVPEAST